MAEIPQEARMFKGATRERVRRAMATVLEPVLREDKKAVSVAKLRGAGSGDQNATTAMLRLWRAGSLSIAEPWDDPAPAPAPKAPVSEDLAELIRAAQTHEDLLAAVKAVALEAMGGMDPEVGRLLVQLAAEMRQSVKGKATDPKDSIDAVLPITDEAEPLVEAFEGIEDDERRARVLEWVQAQAEEDRRKRPSLDTGGAGATT